MSGKSGRGNLRKVIMQHKIILAVIGAALAILLIYSLGFRKGGSVKKAKNDIVYLDIYTFEETDAAVEVVYRYFEKNFDRCTMENIWVVEEATDERAAELAKNEDVDQALVLWSNVKTGWMHGDLSLESFEDYYWEWVMIQNEDGEWEIADNGITYP